MNFWSEVKRDHPDYIRWYVGDACSALGAAMSAIPITLIAIEISGDPKVAGAVAGLGAAAYFLMSLPAGIIIDSFDKRKLLAVYGASQLILWGAFAVAVVLGLASTPALVVFSVLNGLVTGALGGLTNAILRFIVSEQLLPAAYARNATRDNFIWLSGGPLGGLLYGIAPAVPFFGQAVCGLGPMFAATAMQSDLSPIKEEEEEEAPKFSFAKFKSDVVFSLTWVWRHARLRALFMVNLALNAATFFLVPAIDIWLATEGVEPFIIGVVGAAFTAGLLVGGIVSDRLRSMFDGGRIIIFNAVWMLCWFAVLMLFGSHWLPILIGTFFLVIPSVAANAYDASFFMLSAPKEKIARAAAGPRLFMGMLPALGPALAGLSISMTDLSGALWFAIACAAVAVLISLGPTIKRLPPAKDFESLPVLH